MDIVAAIRGGDVAKLQSFLEQDPALATARIDERTLLHHVADWPGHLPNGPKMVEVLARCGADLNARMNGETPLHWAASNDDVALIDALLDAGAHIEATGAVFTGGPPMSDAVVFAQWNAARRLLERGAKTTYWQAAALGLLDEVRSYSLSQDDVTNGFWNACRGGHRNVAEYLLSRGADPNWIGHDDKTPLQVAEESGNRELVEWLREQGAR
jgi:ankyrin repeat protein